MAIVIAVDTIALGLQGPWKTLEARVPRRYLFENPGTVYRQRLREILDEPDSRRVFVVGSSRAMMGFEVPSSDTPGLSDVSFVRLTQAAIEAFQIRSAVDEIVTFDPDVVVLMLSEFDTHRPVTLWHLTSFGSFSAIGDLLVAAGISFGLSHRMLIERLALEATLNSYRYRRILGYAGLDQVRRFRFDRRYPRPSPPVTDNAIFTGTPTPFTPGQYEQALAVLDVGSNRRDRAADMDRIRQITRGRHAEVNMFLLRRAVARLHDSGASVIVVETPLSPAAAILYDTSIRLDFLEFMNELIAEYGVRFVPLELVGSFEPDDFRGFSHAAEGGRAKLTRTVLRAVRDELAAIRLR